MMFDFLSLRIRQLSILFNCYGRLNSHRQIHLGSNRTPKNPANCHQDEWLWCWWDFIKQWVKIDNWITYRLLSPVNRYKADSITQWWRNNVQWIYFVVYYSNWQRVTYWASFYSEITFWKVYINLLIIIALYNINIDKKRIRGGTYLWECNKTPGMKKRRSPASFPWSSIGAGYKICKIVSFLSRTVCPQMLIWDLLLFLLSAGVSWNARNDVR